MTQSQMWITKLKVSKNLFSICPARIYFSIKDIWGRKRILKDDFAEASLHKNVHFVKYVVTYSNKLQVPHENILRHMFWFFYKKKTQRTRKTNKKKWSLICHLWRKIFSWLPIYFMKQKRNDATGVTFSDISFSERKDICVLAYFYTLAFSRWNALSDFRNTMTI